MAVARLWAHTQDESPERAREWVRQLAERELITVEGDRIILHDLQRDFLLLRVRSLRLLHHELLEAYRTLLPTPRSPWRDLPHDEPYILEHLIWHLIGAGDTKERNSDRDRPGVPRDPRLPRRITRRRTRRALRRQDRPENDAIAWVLELLAQWGHLLAGHDRLADLAATLLTRVTAPRPGVNTGTLNALLRPAR